MDKPVNDATQESAVLGSWESEHHRPMDTGNSCKGLWAKAEVQRIQKQVRDCLENYSSMN